MNSLASQEIESENPESGTKFAALPESVSITTGEIEAYWDLWLIWRITGKRHLLSALKNEVKVDYDIVLEMESNYQALLGVKREKKHG